MRHSVAELATYTPAPGVVLPPTVSDHMAAMIGPPNAKLVSDGVYVNEPLAGGAGTPPLDSATKPWSETWTSVYVVPPSGKAKPIACAG